MDSSVDLRTLRAEAFEHSPWPALMFSSEGALLAANESAEQLFGHGLSLLARRKFIHAADDALTALVERARLTGASVREHKLEIHLPGQPAVETEAAAVPLPGGSILLTLASPSHSPSGERATDALRSVAGMGRTLAHEIKNPLAGIRGAAQLLKFNASPEDQTLAQVIVDETDRIHRLVDRVEAFADEREVERRPVNIHVVLDRVRALMVSGVGEGLTFRENYDPSLPPAWGDEDQLIQIFLNLAKNAAEAAHSRGDGRGEVLLSTAYRHGIRMKAAKNASNTSDRPRAPLEVRVQDNGPGVPPNLRDHLFEPFITTKSQGTGLGLTLVAKLVADHGGSIDFTSEPGRTVFRVHLPVEPVEGVRPVTEDLP
ncbi:MAG: ATP-binding protein [Caulobacteraceae bacterium]